jgi:rsbT antagonist protein RsbS
MPDKGFRLTALGDGGALLEPGMGINPSDPAPLIEAVLGGLSGGGYRTLYYDLIAVEVIDPTYFSYLNRLARSCRTVGVTMVCIHMKPATAFALAGFMSAPPAFAIGQGVGNGQRGTGRLQ